MSSFVGMEYSYPACFVRLRPPPVFVLGIGRLFGFFGFPKDADQGQALLRKAASAGHADAESWTRLLQDPARSLWGSNNNNVSGNLQSVQQFASSAELEVAKEFAAAGVAPTRIAEILQSRVATRHLEWHVQRAENRLEDEGQDAHELFFAASLTDWKEKKGQVDREILLKRCAELGYALAMGQLCSFYYFKDRFEECLIWAKVGSEQGDPESLFVLAKCFYFGHGTKKNYSKALGLFQRAAELGHLDAMHELSICYHYGHGSPKDCMQRGYWLAKCASWCASFGGVYSSEFFSLLEEECGGPETTMSITSHQQIVLFGWLLYGNVHANTIWGCDESRKVEAARIAIRFYVQKISMIWIFCGKRLRLPRDIYRMIALFLREKL